MDEAIGNVAINNFLIETNYYYDQTLVLHGRGKIGLKQLINSFLNSSINCEIIITNGYSVALIKKLDEVYLFDSHSKTVLGNVSVNGKASLMRFLGNFNLIASNLLKQISKFSKSRNYLSELALISCSIIATDNINMPINECEASMANSNEYFHDLDNDYSKINVINTCVTSIEVEEPNINGMF